MTYELTNPDRFVTYTRYDENGDEDSFFTEEEINSFIKDGAWDPEEYDLTESYSTSMNLLRNRRLYITTVAESFDRKIALAIITDERDVIRAFVSFNPEGMNDFEFEMKEVRLVKGFNGWWATINWVDPFKITLLTERNLWNDIWREYPPLGGFSDSCSGCSGC